ncbi:MAG: GreA/GreB family elongation factor [Planctomycetota bacterium]
MTDQENELSPATKRLQKLAKSRLYDELESAWLETVQADPRCADDLFPVFDLLVRRGDTELAESLLSYLLIEQAERLGAKDAVATIAKAAARLPGSASLRGEAVELYRSAHASRPAVEAMIQATVAADDTPLPDAIARLEKLLALEPGTYILDEKAPGRVVRFDEEAKALVVEFADGERRYDAASIKGLLILDPNDFRALAAFDRPRLQRLAAEDPGELVAALMRAFGRELTYRDIRERLKDVLDVSWNTWWADAKVKIRRSPWLDVSEGTQPKFTLRRAPVAVEERIREDFDSAKSSERKLATVLDYVEGMKGEDRDVLQRFAANLASIMRDAVATEPAVAVAGLAVIHHLHERFPDLPPEALPSLAEVLSVLRDPSDTLRFTQDDRLSSRVLAFLRASLPDRWHEWYAGALPGASAAACDLIAQEIVKAGHEDALKAAASRVVAEPERGPLALVWLWKAVGAGEHPNALQHIDGVAVLLGLLRLAHDTKRKGGRDEGALAEIRGALSAREYATVRRVVSEIGAHRAQEVRDAAERNLGLSDHAKAEILHALYETHGDLFKEIVPPWEEEVIYTTREGLQRRREEHARLVNIDLDQAERDVGRAASFGDLSENAEYTAALEQRDRLARKAGMMVAELSKARAITQAMVHTDHVTVGVRVKTRNLNTGAEEIFTFLGPWDADAEKGIYSYLAPLSLAFMGKTVGDTVSFSVNSDERKWEVVEIASAI